MKITIYCVLTTFFLLFSLEARPTIFKVGPGLPYTKPSQVSPLVADGDTVEIEAGVYIGDVTKWTRNNLLIRGVNGRPSLEAAGQSAEGKAIWVVKGNNTYIENIEFSGCSVPDHNGAGIRQEGTNLILYKCYFHHNEMGVLSGADSTSVIHIEGCEFAYSGFGDGYSHNVYIGHIKQLIFKFNYTHRAKIGHCLKSRAAESFIYYNRIMDETDGTSSRLIDVPNGGLVKIVGNIMMESQTSENNNLIGYGLEGFTYTDNRLYVVNNTMVSERTTQARYLSIKDGVQTALIQNNIFAGAGVIVEGVAADTVSNAYYPNVNDAPLIDRLNYDYHLTPTAYCIDKGTPAPDDILTPKAEYLHPTDSVSRLLFGAIDMGAYEFQTPEETDDYFSKKDLEIYPNPTFSETNIQFDKEKFDAFTLINAQGQTLEKRKFPPFDILKLDLSERPAGLYYLLLEKEGGKFISKPIVKTK